MKNENASKLSHADSVIKPEELQKKIDKRLMK